MPPLFGRRDARPSTTMDAVDNARGVES